MKTSITCAQRSYLPETHCLVTSISYTKEGDRSYSGTICFRNGIKMPERVGWMANSNDKGQWEIQGDGALLGGEPVLNKECYPFSMDELVNRGILAFLPGFLNGLVKKEEDLVTQTPIPGARLAA